jgi:TonB-linked SusC/RagA family outer membrane protein
VRRQKRSPLAVALALLPLLALLALPAIARAQDGRIVGLVTDSASGQPLPNVAVSVAGTPIGAVTGNDGRYTITRVPAGTRTVEARRIGFAQQQRVVTLAADATVTVDFRLAATPFRLQEQVITGVADPTAGVKVPFTVAKVTSADMPVPAVDAFQAIQGKVAGATIVPGGQPGTDATIQLRTPASINKSRTPLLVVDGIILGETMASTADLDALDIESVEVVKGAAAASLYGSRAQNGVIQIRTKRGTESQAGRTRYLLRSEMGSSDISNQISYARYHFYRMDPTGRFYVNAAGDSVGRAGRVSEAPVARFQDNPYPTPIFDNIDRFFDPGQSFVNSVTVSNNGPNTNWLTTVANHRQDGVLLTGGGFKRSDARLNLDHRPRQDLSLSFSTYYMRSKRDDLYDDTFFDLIFQPPDFDLRSPDPDGTPFIFLPEPVVGEENPLYVNANQSETNRRARVLGNGTIRYAPLSWLSFDGNLSFDRTDRTMHFFRDRGVKIEGQPLGATGRIVRINENAAAFNGAASATLLGRLDQLTARATLRGVVEREDRDWDRVGGEDLAAKGVPDLNNVRLFDQPESAYEGIRARGYFVSTGLDFAGRIIGDALVRRDGSSLFGERELWHTYYRTSLAYRPSQEAWWPMKQQLEEFKLRVSRGTAGGRPSYRDEYETYDFESGGTLVKATLGNPFLKPERTTETEIGLDFIAFGRLSGQLSYARNRVVDQLILVPLSAAYGFRSQWQNAGTVEGHSAEATLEANLFRTSTQNLRLGMIFDRVRHRVTEFNRGCFQTNTVFFRCPGVSLGEMFGFKFITSPNELRSVHANSRDQFQVNDDGLLVPVGPNTSWRDGVARNLWGTTVTIDNIAYPWGRPITLTDESTGNPAVVKIGNANPDYRLGFSANYSWRNFSLYGLLDSQVGGNVYHRTKQRMYQWQRSADVDQVGKPDERKKPIEYYTDLYNGNNVTSWFVEDGGFVKLREVSLRYKLGSALLNPLARTGVRGVTAALIGRNLWTGTDYTGYDPEAGGAINRLDDFIYPNYRTITGSIEVEF